MEKEDVVALIRSLLSSTSSTYNIPRLLREFKEEAGVSLPLFGYRNTSEFLRSIPDTVKLVGDPPNEQICLVLSKKSAHVVELVDNQKVTTKRRRRPPRPSSRPYRPSSSRPSFSGGGGGRRPPPRRDDPPRRDYSSRNDRSPRRDPPKSSYAPAGSRTTSSSKTYRAKSPENLPAFVSPYDQERFYEFLEDNPDGVSFEEVTKFMLNPNESWSKYYIKYGVPELVEYCSAFSAIHADKVYSLENYKKFMRKTKVEVNDGACQPAGNESSYSEDDFYDCGGSESDYEDEYYEKESSKSSKSAEHSVDNNKAQKNKSSQCDINTFKARLKEIMKGYPQGIWCTDLLDVYEKFYNEELKFQCYGCPSLIHLLLLLKDVVTCKQPGDGDWKIFAASNERKEEADILYNVKQNLLKVLNAKDGIQEDEIPPMYYKMFKERLNFDDFGFDDLRSFLYSFEGELFYTKRRSNKIVFVPKYQMILDPSCSKQKTRSDNVSLSHGSAENELYPEEVVGLNEKLPEFDLRKYAKIGEYVEVCVGEVWSPHKFFLQLRRFKPELFNLMERLQTWYNNYSDVHKMPDETIVPGQVCVALYQLNEDSAEWHRAVIKKKLDDKSILISLVDYGTVTKTTKNRLRFLHKDFSEVPVQAVGGRLANIVPKDSTKWSDNACRRFLDLVFDKDLVCGVVDIDYKLRNMSVALSYTKGVEIHIADTLEAEGFASFVQNTVSKPVPQPQRQPAGPNKAMKSTEEFKIEPVDIFEVDEPENIVEIIKTKVEKEGPEKSKKPVKSAPLPSTNPVAPKDNAAAAAASGASSLLTTNPLLATNPLAASNPLASPPLAPYTDLLAENPALLNLNPMQKNLVPQTPNSDLLEQMGNLSLLGSAQTSPPTRPPPGFAPLTQEEIKEKVNTEALKLLWSQPHINAIAKTNLDLAMKLAVTIAEDHVQKEVQRLSQPPPLAHFQNPPMYYPSPNLNFQNPNLNIQNATFNLQTPNANLQNPKVNVQKLNLNLKSPIPNIPTANQVRQSPESPEPKFQNPNVAFVYPQAVSPPKKSSAPGPKRKIQIQMDEDEFKTSAPNTLPDIVKYTEKEAPKSKCLVYSMKLEEKPFHVISLDDRLFVLAEEVIKRYTPFSTKEMADKILRSKRISFQFNTITKLDCDAYREIARWNIPVAPNGKEEFNLVPLKSFMKYLKSMVTVPDSSTLAIYQFVDDCETELKPFVSD